jgi:hypothetical protein
MDKDKQKQHSSPLLLPDPPLLPHQGPNNQKGTKQTVVQAHVQTLFTVFSVVFFAWNMYF